MTSGQAAGGQSGPSVIDVLIAVDAETIVASYEPGTPEAPSSIDRPLLYMIVRQGNAVFGDGSKELKIAAEVLDEIRWRATTLSLGAGRDVLLYQFVALHGGQLLSTPTPVLVHLTEPLPNPADPLHPSAQAAGNYFWNTTVLGTGSVTYTFQFAVADREGNMTGYYSWDPFITITD